MSDDDAGRTWYNRGRAQPAETIHDARGKGAPGEAPGTIHDGARPGVHDSGASSDGGGQEASLTVVIPPALRERFRDFEELRHGAEGTVLQVAEIETGERRILKLYRPDVDLDVDAVETLRRISNDPEGRWHVVNLFEADRADGQWYEVQEHCPGGSLQDLLDRKAHVDVARVVEQVGRSLAYLEGRLHLRDVKPSNLLLRSLDELEVVPGDFGLARSTREGAMRFTMLAGTPLYFPPEATELRLTPAWDWWSFGMVVGELALGHHPLALPDGRLPALEHIPALVRDHAVDVSGVADERLRNLCRGLLVRDYRLRWRGEQVQRWLAGENPEVPRNDALSVAAAPAEQRDVEARVQFAGEVYREPLPLAQAFQRQWQYAIERLFVDRDLEWVASVEAMLRECGLLGAAQTVKQGLSRGATPSRAMAMLLLEMSPDIEPVFDGMSLTPDGLREAADDVLAGRRDGARLDEVRRSGVLLRWRSLAGIASADRITEHWGAGVERIEQLVDLVNARETRLDRPAADRAKAWLLLSLLGRHHQDDLLAEVRDAALGSAASIPWWHMLADQATDDRSPSLPAAALAAVTHPQAAFQAEEREFHDEIGEQADRVLQSEMDELDMLRRSDEDAAAVAPGCLAQLLPRFRWPFRRRRPWYLSGRALGRAGPPRLPAWLITTLAAVLVGWHLSLLSGYEGRLRFLFTDPLLPEPGTFDHDLATLDGLTRRVEVMAAVVVAAVVANAVGLLLVRRRIVRDRSPAARSCAAVAAVLQVLALGSVVDSGRIHLVLGRAANGYERAGFPEGYLPQWARAGGLLFGVVVMVALLALAMVAVRSWRSVRRGERYF